LTALGRGVGSVKKPPVLLIFAFGFFAPTITFLRNEKISQHIMYKKDVILIEGDTVTTDTLVY
jgi:hypothetical protein